MAREIEAELLQKLGKLVTSWALVDQYMAHLFIGMVEGEPGSLYVVTENVSCNTISDWIGTLLDARSIDPPGYADKIREAIQEACDLRGQRNALVHGLWSTGHAEPGSVMVQTIRLERAEVVKGELVTGADLDELIDRISIVASDLETIIREMDFPNNPLGRTIRK